MLVKKDRSAVSQMGFTCTEAMVPQNHLLRAVHDSMDFDFIYEEVKDMYSETHGRPSVDPVVLIKILMLQAMYGIRSMRQTIQEIEVNLAYRWFLGYGIYEQIPHFSTFGKNYVRRFQESDLFDKIFERVVEEAIQCGFIEADVVFIDSTHVKANANKNKHIKKAAKKQASKYKDELMKEINEDRKAHGKSLFDDDNDDENSTPGSGEERIVKESTTDPESGLFRKGEKERCFAYGVTVACERNNFVLGLDVTPGNVHDSQSFSGVFKKVRAKYPEIEEAVADAAYKTPGVCREIINAGINPIMPYKRPMTKDGYFKKYEYVYDEYYDCYLCPNNQVLTYRTTNRDGYREYKSDPKVCCNCQHLSKCTQSKNFTKVVTRHIWEPYMEMVEDLRHTPRGKELYKKRGETIERVFADAKEKHGMRYTQYRGVRKVKHYLTLLFACMNLKKLATWKRKQRQAPPPVETFVSLFYELRLLLCFKKKLLLDFVA